MNNITNNLLKLPEVIKITGKSRSSIYSGMKDGSFIKPIKIGQRSIAFVESELVEWIDKRIKAAQVDHQSGLNKAETRELAESHARSTESTKSSQDGK